MKSTASEPGLICARTFFKKTHLYWTLSIEHVWEDFYFSARTRQRTYRKIVFAPLDTNGLDMRACLFPIFRDLQWFEFLDLYMFHGTWPVPIKLITCNFLWVKCLSWRFTYPSIVLTSAAVNFKHSLYLRHWRNDYQNNTKQSHISLHLKDVVSLFHQLVLFFFIIFIARHHHLSNSQKFINEYSGTPIQRSSI